MNQIMVCVSEFLYGNALLKNVVAVSRFVPGSGLHWTTRTRSMLIVVTPQIWNCWVSHTSDSNPNYKMLLKKLKNSCNKREEFFHTQRNALILLGGSSIDTPIIFICLHCIYASFLANHLNKSKIMTGLSLLEICERDSILFFPYIYYRYILWDSHHCEINKKWKDRI